MQESNLTQKSFQIIKCEECDASVETPLILNKDEQAECPRCHHHLATGGRWSVHRCAMVALSILILMPFALSYPLLSLHLLGVKIDASIWEGIWKMSVAGYEYTAFMVFICAVVMPITFAILVIMLWIAKILHIKPRSVLLFLGYIKPWVMFDVYLVALGVTMFKVREYATLEINVYLIPFIFTALLTTLLFIKLNLKALWKEFYPENEPAYDANNIELCDAWASLIAGIIMLFPANLLPISGIYLTGSLSEDTLISGVISFVNMGSYFVAFVVFFASIFVPISKAAILLYLLSCVHFKWRHSIKWQIRLLHIVHFVGRWSMLDLFVLALMMSLVTRGEIINFTVGPGAFYFGAAVFCSMISTSQFDSRLIWKIYDREK